MTVGEADHFSLVIGNWWIQSEAQLANQDFSAKGAK